MTTVVCKQCQKNFYAKPSWIKNGYGIYCSRVCKFAASRTGKVVNCSICNKETYKKGKALRGSQSGKFFVVNLVKQSGEMLNFQWKNTLIGKMATVPTAVSLADTPKRSVNVAVPRIFGF